MSDDEPRLKTPERRRIKKPKARIITDRDEIRRSKAEMRQAKPDLWWFITRFAPVWVLLLGIVIIEPTLPFRAMGALLEAVIPQRQAANVYQPEVVYIVEDPPESPNVAELPPPDWDLTISPIFTDEVQYWREGIANWSIAYRIEPNLIATIMQIESCGNPNALSSAGAQGLFQVLDLHFEAGEDPFDPETNAKRGLLFYGELLGLTNLDESLSFAAYNAGPSVINRSPSQWPRETQDYQFWASGISEEAEMNIAQSPTLNEWLEAGGASLCAQAAQELGLSGE